MKKYWNFLGKMIFTQLLLCGISLVAFSQSRDFQKKQQFWVDSVYNSLSMQERIAQLLCVRASADGDTVSENKIAKLVTDYNLGGICFFKGNPTRQAILTNKYQSLAKTSIFISMDAEWGPAMRLDSLIAFPRQMTMGACQNDEWIEKYGREIARELKRLGVHISYSPVADINNNPKNQVINSRSFGESKEDVTRRAILYMKGLQKGGIISVAKHFPGHGDTEIDSHYALPVISKTREQLSDLELYPFRQLINAGVDGMMVAHLNVLAFADSGRNLPSSISPRIIRDLLQKELNFKGLVFTDALDMKGVTDVAKPGEIEVMALQAGADVLVLPQSVQAAMDEIGKAVENGALLESVIEAKCKKVLAAKYKAGLYKKQQIQVKNLISDLNSTEAQTLNRQFYENAVTVLKNNKAVLPVEGLDTLKIASVVIGYTRKTAFQKRLDSYADVKHFNLPQDPSPREIQELLTRLKPFNLVLLAVANTHPSPARNFGVSKSAMVAVDTLLSRKRTVLNIFGIPYALSLFKNAHKAEAITISYQDNPTVYDVTAQMLFGAISAKGELPVTIDSAYPIHSGLEIPGGERLKFTLPEDVGISSILFQKVDSIVNTGLKANAYPGCQVLITKDGRVIYQKSFGYHDYLNQQPVSDTSVYDLASLTKVAATTLAVMKLYDENKIELSKPLADYLPALDFSNKNQMTVKDVMAHQARLLPWIPFYLTTLHDGKPDTTIYRKASGGGFTIQVADSLYIINTYPAKILDSIIKSPLLTRKEYKYSDLGFILMKEVVENQTRQPLNVYLDENFYAPLGLKTLGYIPLGHFPKEQIIPTENDQLFRHQLIQGYVHDPAAAMLGGVSGHAGLFGNAEDLAVLFQMLLQNGEYGGVNYLSSEIVRKFTSQAFKNNRRGLGFDKPQLVRSEPGPACEEASMRSFGHTGFTGTMVWADPDKQLIIVFLSNRVNPDAGNQKITQMGIRTDLQKAVYEILKKSKSDAKR